MYDELYAMYRDLYPATQPTVHALARLQERVSRSVQGLADPAPAGQRQAMTVNGFRPPTGGS